MTNFEGAKGHLLQVRPNQSGNDRRLIEMLVHLLVIMKCLPPNGLLQPLADLAFDPASTKVRLISNSFIRSFLPLETKCKRLVISVN